MLGQYNQPKPNEHIQLFKRNVGNNNDCKFSREIERINAMVFVTNGLVVIVKRTRRPARAVSVSQTHDDKFPFGRINFGLLV